MLALTLSFSVLGAAIPITTVATSCTTTATTTETLESCPGNGPTGALWKNNIHARIYSSEASVATPTSEGDFSKYIGPQVFIDTYSLTSDRRATVRRSGELWRGSEHEEVDPIVVTSTAPALPRRSGELWRGLEHERIEPLTVVTSTSPALPRRSGELWRGLEHEEVARASPAPPRRSGELWRGLEHEAVSASPV